MALIVVLTGAGISAESGLGTFRDAGGIWSRYDLGKVATAEGFAADPALVHEFYNARRARAMKAAPNPAHEALARLQSGAPGDLMIVTQNVDDLHERAGARAVIHMHGRLSRALCAACGCRWEAPLVMHEGDPCPACGACATRPDVVWFGEMPHRMEEIDAALSACELFVSIGTSGQVWPAAGLVERARAAGARCLELNLERSEISHRFHEVRLGPASELVPAWVRELGA